MRCWREFERDPSIPTIRPVFGFKFFVGSEIEVALHGTDRENEPDLWTNAHDLGLEAADAITGAAVATDLPVDVTY